MCSHVPRKKLKMEHSEHPSGSVNFSENSRTEKLWCSDCLQVARKTCFSRNHETGCLAEGAKEYYSSLQNRMKKCLAESDELMVVRFKLGTIYFQIKTYYPFNLTELDDRITSNNTVIKEVMSHMKNSTGWLPEEWPHVESEEEMKTLLIKLKEADSMLEEWEDVAFLELAQRCYTLMKRFEGRYGPKTPANTAKEPKGVEVIELSSDSEPEEKIRRTETETAKQVDSSTSCIDTQPSGVPSNTTESISVGSPSSSSHSSGPVPEPVGLPSNMWQCSVCELTFKLRFHYLRHFRKCHSSNV